MMRKPILWLIIVMFGLFQWLETSAQSSVVEDFKVTITFVDEPGTGLQIYKAPLKYNKDFALVLQLNNGNPAINDQVLPYFKGQAGNPGLFFTEGQPNSKQPFKMDAVHYLFDENGIDVDFDIRLSLKNSSAFVMKKQDKRHAQHQAIQSNQHLNALKLKGGSKHDDAI